MSEDAWIEGRERLPDLGEPVMVRYGGRLHCRGERVPGRSRAHVLFRAPGGNYLAATPPNFAWRPLVDDPNAAPPCSACGSASACSPRSLPPYLCTACAAREAALRASFQP